MYVWKYFFNEICPLQFWNSNYVTGSGYSSGYHDLGGVRWQLALCYLLAFICVILALSKSIKTSGKVRWQLAHARDVTMFIQMYTLEPYFLIVIFQTFTYYIFSLYWMKSSLENLSKNFEINMRVWKTFRQKSSVNVLHSLKFIP